MEITIAGQRIDPSSLSKEQIESILARTRELNLDTRQQGLLIDALANAKQNSLMASVQQATRNNPLTNETVNRISAISQPSPQPVSSSQNPAVLPTVRVAATPLTPAAPQQNQIPAQTRPRTGTGVDVEDQFRNYMKANGYTVNNNVPTANLIANFQRANRLPVTGQFDDQTLSFAVRYRVVSPTNAQKETELKAAFNQIDSDAMAAVTQRNNDMMLGWL